MENKNNSGIIFKNDKKGNDKAPDYKGKVKVNNQDMDIALWVRESAKGKFFSASFSEPYKKDALPSNINSKSESNDLPF